jgi:sugar-specific transcriptional regulator TrmB
MDETSEDERAIELLQQLGLKEYEAKCFVALTRLPQATAKEVSEVSDVPRTRVYDATRVLESKGLVEVQHANPQRFRAVGIDEAIETLRDEYESRVVTLREALQSVEPADRDEETDVSHEVWSLSRGSAIENRTQRLIGEATEEVLLVLGGEALTDALVENLRGATDRNVSVLVGADSEQLRDRLQTTVPDAEAFISGLDWLRESSIPGDETQITRLMLVDRQAILVSTHGNDPGGGGHERAVFGRGFDNGLVTVGRRLMATGLLPGDDPGRTDGA